jgi:NAD(P)-dependent dehydrogenase (short-subunit alcohol dehydrogenase family)
MELRHSGIKVSLIEPGPIRTRFTDNVNQTGDRVAQLRLIADKSVAHFFHYRLRPEGKTGGDARVAASPRDGQNYPRLS